MSFFIKKGKQVNGFSNHKSKGAQKRKRKPIQPAATNEEIESSSDEDVLNKDRSVEHYSSSEDEKETAQEKKVRLAKIYLEEIAKEEKQRLEDQEDGSDDLISKRLKEDYLKQAGKLRRIVADTYIGADGQNISLLKCKDHRNSVTCLCISDDNKFIYSGSKNSGIVKWSVSDLKRVQSVPHINRDEPGKKGHSKSILCVAISSDSKFLAVGDESKDINIWNPETMKHMNTLKGHRDSVTGLTFRKETHTLYSCSKDRSVRVWSLDEMAYVETLFGHQDGITAIDSLLRERAVSAGGRDNSLRLWKIAEESQLIFNGHSGSIDVVKLINEEHFISGGDDGQLCVWSMMKKKPLCSVKEAHGIDPTNSQPYWISAVASLVNTDLVASGSQDGVLRLWKLGESFRTISLMYTVPVVGFVNSLAFTSDGQNLVAAVGQEHKLGRWNVIKSAKNGVAVIPLLNSR